MKREKAGVVPTSGTIRHVNRFCAPHRAVRRKDMLV
jgi:hypothetical protein